MNLDVGTPSLSGLEDAVSFDINATGRARIIGWTSRGSNVAFVALDLNGNGVIDDGHELFGNAMLLASGVRAENGFEALAQFDSDTDGDIDSDDAVWPKLLLWIDGNHDGVTQAEEITHVGTSEITSFDLSYHWSGRRDPHGNYLRYEGKFHIGKRVRSFYDAFFVVGN